MVQDNEVQKQKEPIKNDVQWANSEAGNQRYV